MTASAVAPSPWAYEARPDVWILIGSIAVAYWWSITRLRPRLAPAPPPPSRVQHGRFVAGLALLWFAVDWPLDRLGDDFLFSAHMVQFLLITMISAPLLVAGIPSWLQRELTAPFGPVVRVALKAPVALLTFQVVLVGTHLPAVVSLYASNSLVHFALHALWVVSGCLFWMPIVGREPMTTALQPPLKIAYLIAATVMPTVPASFLTWTETAFYEPYANAPRVWGISAVLDLQVAGLVMKLGGGVILWGFIIAVFARWASSERHADLAASTTRPPR